MEVFISAFLATFFIVFVPPLISCITVVECIRKTIDGEPKYRNWLRDRVLIKYIFSLHPNKGLSSQGLFWLAIMIPFSYFVFLGAFAWNGYILRLDAEGFKTFISISALPLGVLSLALPLSVSVARFHSSKQTARQIEIVSQKNNLDLYNSHRKELFGYFDQLGEFKYLENFTVKNNVHPRVYKTYFQGLPSDGIPKINDKAFKRIERLLNSSRTALIDIIDSKDHDEAVNIYLVDFGRDIYESSELLGIPEILDLMKSSPRVPCKIKGNNLQLETIGRSTYEAVAAFRCIENFFHNLCDFANYESEYFSNDNYRKEFNEVVRINGKKNLSDMVIESLHINQLKKLIDDDRYQRMYPNSPPRR